MNNKNYTDFAQLDKNSKYVWGPILEKAWAKIRVNYLNLKAGMVEDGIGMLAGIPVLTYKPSEVNNLWNAIKSAD